MPVTIAINGRYIRRSAPTSVAIGTKLDEGASVMKNHAPRNAAAAFHRNAATVSNNSATTAAACGRTSEQRVRNGRSVVDDEITSARAASRRYRTIITDWFSRYVHTLTPVAKPAEPARGRRDELKCENHPREREAEHRAASAQRRPRGTNRTGRRDRRARPSPVL